MSLAIKGIDMATRESLNWWQGTVNPFHRAAIADTSKLRPEGPSIPTREVKEMRELVDEYVSGTRAPKGGTERSELPPNDGMVIVVEGGFGAGKTHLVLEALGRIADARRLGLDPRPCYLVAPGGSFLMLYTEVMGKYIGRGELLARVREFYADIVAEDLRGQQFAERLVGQLERDEVDPQIVVERYGLREGALLAELRNRLSAVTGDEAFSRAMILLLQPELREIVWDWFTGGTPGQLLREHGLARPIETDIQAMEALGVIARVYRRRERRFVLAIDEMERLVLTWDRSDQVKAQAFKKLLEVFRRTGALLIMAGLPDIFEILPNETRRVDRIIEPSPLDSEDIRGYIEETIQNEHRRRTIEPFTPGGIDYIVYLTGGLAREVIRLCYFGYDSAAATGEMVTSGLVNTLAQTRSRRDANELVHSEILRLLLEQARTSNEGWVFSDIPEVTVDFWVPVGDQGAGCAVLVTDSILDDHQAELTAQRISTIRSSAPERAIIQVVSGYLPARQRRKLEEALNEDPLVVYSPGSFARDFTRVLSSVVTSIVGDTVDSFPGGSELRVLREETDRLARQQAAMLRLIQESASREEHLLSTVQRTLTAAIRAPGPTAENEVEELPAELAEMFRAADDGLTVYGDAQALVNNMFGLAAETSGVPFALVYQLRELDSFSSIGVMTFLTALLRGFQQGVRTWFSSLGPAAERAAGPTAREREWLYGICQTYGALYGVAPLFELDRLWEITNPPGTELDLLRRAGQTRRAESLRAAFDGLGDRVYAAAVRLADTSSGGGPQ